MTPEEIASVLAGPGPANLRGASLMGANFEGANLRGASLEDANLKGANFEGANLMDANLEDANLKGAYLMDANLEDANLKGAYLRGANLIDANLRGANLPFFQIPDGDLVGWKKCDGHIVRLRIPYRAKRTGSLVGRKCRAELAEVIEVEGAEMVLSNYSRLRLPYRPGETVVPDSYDDDPRVECTHGIHFFLTRAEAEEW